MNKGIENRMRGSIEVKDRNGFGNIFNKIPMGMKMRNKIKNKARTNQNTSDSSVSQEGTYFKSQTNVKSKVKVNFKETFQKMKPARTKTINSDDDFSDHSSDLDF